MRLNSLTNNEVNRAGTARVPRHMGAASGAIGFTLAEMLVVIAIISIILGVAIPAMKGLMESNTMSSATRQMLDDVAFARQKAISSRSRVYMVFIAPEFWTNNIIDDFNHDSRVQLTNLVKGQYVSYALFSERSLGDQPGAIYPKYLTSWRTLPEGILIETNKFNLTTNFPLEVFEDPYDDTRVFRMGSFLRKPFPFPPTEVTNANPKEVILPYIAFSPSGGLWRPDGVTEDEFLPLAKGSVFYMKKNGQPDFEMPDAVVNGYREADRTNFTLVRIDRLTGRAKIEKLELQ